MLVRRLALVSACVLPVHIFSSQLIIATGLNEMTVERERSNGEHHELLTCYFIHLFLPVGEIEDTHLPSHRQNT